MDMVDGMFVVNGLVADGYSYLATSKNSDQRFVAALKSAIASMIKDGTWDSIYNSYKR